VGNKFSLFSGY